MIPPVFTIPNASAAVKLVLGNPLRLYAAEAPQNPTKPYAIWQGVSGFPENYLGQVPDMDTFITQVDVYGTTEVSARNGAAALRNVYEPVAHIVAWRGPSRDAETGLYRYSFDVDFKTPR